MYAKKEIPAPFSQKTTPFPEKTTSTNPQKTTNFSPLLALLLFDLISTKS